TDRSANLATSAWLIFREPGLLMSASCRPIVCAVYTNLRNRQDFPVHTVPRREPRSPPLRTAPVASTRSSARRNRHPAHDPVAAHGDDIVVQVAHRADMVGNNCEALADLRAAAGACRQVDHSVLFAERDDDCLRIGLDM